MEADNLWKTVTYAAIAVAGLVLYLFYTYCYAPYQVLKRANIRGPTPDFLLGNYREIHAKGIVKFIDDLIAKYGPYSAYYIGSRPYMLVSDLDMLKQIMIKDFNNFTDKPELTGFILVSKIAQKGMLTAGGNQWRQSRRILSPTFSTSKLKMMVPIIQECIDHTMHRFTSSCDSGTAVDVFSWYGNYTMDVLFAATFGASRDSIGEHGALITAIDNAMTAQQPGGFMHHMTMRVLLSNFPWLAPVCHFFGSQSAFGLSWGYMEATAKKIVSERRSQGIGGKRKDMLQLILAASEDEMKQTPHNYNKSITNGLNDHEIVAHLTHLFIGGYETTSNCLAYTSYLLALHPDKQDTLYQEIEKFYQENPTASIYDACQGIQYLEMVLFESLRIFPPVARTMRVANETRVINGVTVPKGVAVDIPIEHIHHDPNIWPEPEKFIPERFSPGEKEKRHPCAFIPFGVGPRNCIGLRFAMLEAKMLLLSIVQQMKFVVCADTEVRDTIEEKVWLNHCS